jgi:hypothetical protein
VRAGTQRHTAHLDLLRAELHSIRGAFLLRPRE